MRPQPRRFIATGLIAAVAAALLGCASTHGGEYGAGGAALSRKTGALPGKPACFRVTDFDGSFTVLNDSELIVPDPVLSRTYLIVLSEPVSYLKLRHHPGFLAFPPHNHLICSNPLDYLLVRRWKSGRVPIVAVRELTAAQERQLLLQNHIRNSATAAGGEPPSLNSSRAAAV